MKHYNKIIQKLINIDVIKEETKEHYSNQPQILDHLYRILITESSESLKINSSFKLINQQPGFDKTDLCDKDPYKAKYQLLIN